jgi:phenylpyruvate tautomerase PptA (4-oxalocrotonate tautomerase family)
VKDRDVPKLGSRGFVDDDGIRMTEALRRMPSQDAGVFGSRPNPLCQTSPVPRGDPTRRRWHTGAVPIVRVTRRKGRTAEENARVLGAVHDALEEAFKIPDTDRMQMLSELEPAALELPPDRTSAFALIEIAAFPGRSADAKRALYAGIVRRLEALGIAPADVMVVLSEPPLESWSVRAGKAAADARVGYKLDA